MNRASIALLVFFCGLLCMHSHAQRIGLLPADVKWYQLRHDSLRIIFPEGHENTARRSAGLMLKLAKTDPIVRKGKYKPITILLQPETNISNGYVGLAPYVSEFYLQPHENPFVLGSLPWTDLLALHEYRHVQQLNAAKTGITNFLRTIFGDLVFSGLYNVAVPNWYREGDAVFTETKWSNQGRGRLSLFTLPFYLKSLEGEPWNYYKVRNGSYREFTPDFYALGYMMIQYGNQSFTEHVWDTILHEAPKFSHPLRPFSSLVHNKYGKYTKGLYADAMYCYRDECALNKTADILYPPVKLQTRDYEVDYLDMQYPVVDGDGSVYVSISSFDKIPAIYKLDQTGRRTKVITTGIQKDPFFHYANDCFVWTEYRLDPRWQRKDRNVIIWYNQKNNQKKIFHPAKGYFTPSLNARGNQIVTLHTDEAGMFQLRILDVNTGDTIRTLPNPENLYLGYPIFAENEKSIYATARNQEGRMCIVEQDIATGSIKFITHYSYSVIGRLTLRGPWLFAATGLDDLDQVFAIHLEEGIFYQVSDGNTAHYSPVWDPVRDEIVCTEYRLDGQKLVRLPGHPRDWKLYNLHDGIKDIGVASSNLLASNSMAIEGEILPYSRWADAFNPHSWLITSNDPVWGIEGRSDNYLNTVSLAAGYEVNRNTNANGPYIDARFGMWFPQLKLRYGRTSREFINDNGEEAEISFDQFSTGIELPLSFTSGAYRQTLIASTTLNGGFRTIKPAAPGVALKYSYARYQLVMINARRMAYRRSMPSWGHRIDISYAHEAWGIPIYQWYTSLELALPTFFPTHYLSVQGERMRQDVNGSVLLSSQYLGPRGFPYYESAKQHHVGITYGFPLWYPDRGFGNIFYTRRLRLQPFYDYAYTDHPLAPSTTMQSAGAELIVDFDFPPISIGFRYSRLISGYEGGADQFTFFIPSQRF